MNKGVLRALTLKRHKAGECIKIEPQPCKTNEGIEPCLKLLFYLIKHFAQKA